MRTLTQKKGRKKMKILNTIYYYIKDFTAYIKANIEVIAMMAIIAVVLGLIGGGIMLLTF